MNLKTQIPNNINNSSFKKQVIESFLITSRETLEASLVVGIVLGYLNRTNNEHYKKMVSYGILLGIAGSLIIALLFTRFTGGFEGTAEQFFEGITMLLGAFLLTTMIVWMLQQKNMKVEIEKKIDGHLQKERFIMSNMGICALITTAILREGVETIIFLNAARYAGGINFIGGLLGVITAIALGYAVFLTSKKINLKHIFTASSLLLLLFAAGLTAHGVHEFEEAGVISATKQLWDINPSVRADGSYPFLHEKGIAGSFLRGLFGYHGDPSAAEVVSYFLYLLIVGSLVYGLQRKRQGVKAWLKTEEQTSNS